jgi:hypothetical protein
MDGHAKRRRGFLVPATSLWHVCGRSRLERVGHPRRIMGDVSVLPEPSEFVTVVRSKWSWVLVPYGRVETGQNRRIRG